MVVGSMMEDGIEDFDQNHYLDSLGVLVYGNMNDTGDGGIVGADIECYAAQGVHWMVEDNMDGVGLLVGWGKVTFSNSW